MSALAAADDVAPTELEYTLAEYIAPEALVNMFATPGGAWEFTFQVPGHEVTVAHSGEIFVDGARYGNVGEASPDDPGTTDRYIRENLPHRQTLLTDIPCLLYRCRNERRRPMEFVSGNCRNLTGYDPNAFVIGGVSYGQDVIHPADRQQVWESIRRSLRTGDPFSHTYRIRTAGDEEKRVWEKGVGVFTDGEAVAHVGFVTPSPADPDARDVADAVTGSR